MCKMSAWRSLAHLRSIPFHLFPLLPSCCLECEMWKLDSEWSSWTRRQPWKWQLVPRMAKPKYRAVVSDGFGGTTKPASDRPSWDFYNKRIHLMCFATSTILTFTLYTQLKVVLTDTRYNLLLLQGFLSLSLRQDRLEDFLKQTTGLHPQSFWVRTLVRGPRTGISNNLPYENTPAAGPT